jgi:aspartyl-tRNA(Asn)/glutamyl-tRNA(Gln) amidotransferase subunit C
MSIDKETMRKVARLGNLHMDDAGLERAVHQVGGIMKWIDQLAEVNTDNVEPLASVVAMELYLREDEVTDGDCIEQILANAPEATQGFFVVPKVVE